MLEKYRKVVFTVLIVVFPFITYGQGGSNSPYSMLGIGNLTGDGFSRNIAMGGVASPLFSPFQLNPQNPASYAAIMPNSFVFEFGINMKAYTLSNENNDFKDFTGNIAYIAAGFPVTKWYKAGIGLKPISSIEYEIEEHQELKDEKSVNNLYIGKGGINSFYLDNSFSINNYLSVGLKLAYVYGTLDKDRVIRTNYVKNTKSTSVISEKNHSVFDAVLVGFGAHFHKKISENLIVNIGTRYNLKTELEGQQDRFTISYITKTKDLSLKDTIFNDKVNEGVLELPQSFSLGASVLLNQKLNLAFDYKIDEWSKTKMFGKSQNLSNNERYSLGMEFSPDYNSTKYFKLIKYRAGIHLTNSYLSVQGENLREIGGSIGFAFPLRNMAIINLSTSYSRRFVPDLDILKEDIFQIHINFSFRSRWFVRSKFY